MGFALSIVGAAIGMTAAASDTVARCDEILAASASEGTANCAPGGSVAPAAAGYQAAPLTADRAPVATAAPPPATNLLGAPPRLAVFFLFAILFINPLPPGGGPAP